MSKTPSGLIVPAHLNPFDLEIRVMFNTRTGTTELRLYSSTLKEFNTLQIAGVLSEHATALLRGIVSGGLKAMPIVETPKDGGNNGKLP